MNILVAFYLPIHGVIWQKPLGEGLWRYIVSWANQLKVEYTSHVLYKYIKINIYIYIIIYIYIHRIILYSHIYNPNHNRNISYHYLNSWIVSMLMDVFFKIHVHMHNIYIYIRLVSKIDQVMDNSPCLTIPNCLGSVLQRPRWKKCCWEFPENAGCGHTYILLELLGIDSGCLKGAIPVLHWANRHFLNKHVLLRVMVVFLLRSPSLLVKAQFLLVMLTLYLVSSYIFGW